MIIEAKRGMINVIPLKEDGTAIEMIMVDFPYPKYKDVLEMTDEQIMDRCCPEGTYAYEYRKTIKGFKFSFVADPVDIEHDYKSRIEKALDRAVAQIYRFRGTKMPEEDIKKELMGED